MTIYLADTNILINALNNKRGHRKLLHDLIGQGHRLACCTVIIAELFSGVRPADIAKVEQFVSTLSWYQATPAIARRAGRLRFEHARKGTALSLPDMLIAATALEHGLTLITDNRKHFPLRNPRKTVAESSAPRKDQRVPSAASRRASASFALYRSCCSIECRFRRFQLQAVTVASSGTPASFFFFLKKGIMARNSAPTFSIG